MKHHLVRKLIKKKQPPFFFPSKSTPDTTRNTIKGMFKVQEIKFYEKYLGLPSLVGRGKNANFNYIKDCIWRKLQGWEGKLLSQAGREVLIKVVIQAIHTYAIGCFRLPLGHIHEIESMIKSFSKGKEEIEEKYISFGGRR